MEDNIFIKKKEKHWVWSFRDISIDTRNNNMNTWTNATRYWLLLKRQFTSKSKLHIFILPVLLFIHLDCFGLSCHVLQICLALGLCKLKSNLQVASSWSYSPSIQLHNLTAQKDTCKWTRGSCSRQQRVLTLMAFSSAELSHKLALLAGLLSLSDARFLMSDDTERYL